MDKWTNAGWVEQTAAETGQTSKTLNPHFIHMMDFEIGDDHYNWT